jgi:hypothetical protein
MYIYCTISIELIQQSLLKRPVKLQPSDQNLLLYRAVELLLLLYCIFRACTVEHPLIQNCLPHRSCVHTA